MRLDTEEWKEFRIGDIFPECKVRHYPATPDEVGPIEFVSSTDANNGVAAKVDCSDLVDGNCITVSTNGSCFSCFYHEARIAVSTDVEVLRHERLNPYNSLFVCTVLNLESSKWSYGRKPKSGKLYDVVVSLPATPSGEPNWQFMEDYIRSLHHKPITTDNRPGDAPDLKAWEWKEFRVGDLFAVELAKGDIKLEDAEPGLVPLVSAGEQDNGVIGHISRNGDGVANAFPGNRLTLDMFCNPHYQAEEFFAVSHGRVNILVPKFALTEEIGLFLSTVLAQERYKFSYGRAAYSGVAADITIKLPATPSGDPDWQFMEDYVRSLPYGDKLPAVTAA